MHPEKMNIIMNINSKAKGFVCGAVAAATYGMNPLFTLPLYKEGMSVDSVLFYRYGFAVLHSRHSDESTRTIVRSEKERGSAADCRRTALFCFLIVVVSEL